MGRTCPICNKFVQNISSHLSRVHKIDGHDRKRLLQEEKLEKGGQRFTPYPQIKHNMKTECDRFQLLHPFTALVAGMTGSGKTVWVQNLLKHANQVIQPPPQRIVWSFSQWQPAYDQMMKTVPGIEFVKGIPHDLDEKWYFDPKINNLMVIDDQMTETSNDKRILNLFTKGSHHRNLSVIFLLQNVYFQGKIMRTLSLNAAYLVLFKNPRDKLQMMTLGKQMYPGKTNQFVQKFEAAVQRSYGYLFVDLKPNTKEECRLRTNVLPNDAYLSQIGGQSDDMKTMTNFFKRQSYLQSPNLKAMQKLEEQMAIILKDPSLPPEIKIKKHEQLYNRYLALQQQQLPNNPLLPKAGQELTSNTVSRVEQSHPSIMTTPPNVPSTNTLSSDSGFATASPKEPSFLQRLTSKVRTPFKSATPQRLEEIPQTPSKVDQPSTSTPIPQSSQVPPAFPPTPPSSRENPKTVPRWIAYQDVDNYPGVYKPPRRSERIRAMIKSIPGWEKY